MAHDERILACIMLHALGDTIGFKNGEWEFNYIDDMVLTLDFVNEMIYEFINLGGVNSINLDTWKVSDDTIFHLYVGNAMLKYKGIIDDNFIFKFKEELIKGKDETIGDQTIERFIGITTKTKIEEFTQDHDARNDEYNKNGGGNGCAMRNLVIGLCLHKEEQLDELIDISIISSQLTHNNAIGYLGGFASALFTSYAIRKIDIQKWPFMLLEQLKSDKVSSFVKKPISLESRDYIDYLSYWERHIENRFNLKDKTLIDANVFRNPMFRLKYYYDQFFVESVSNMIGDSGILAVIMAYDAVLDSEGVWEKLIMYGMLHPGDSDTVGAIAAGIFGAYYGFSDVPKKMYKNIEYKKEINSLASKIEEKYF